MIQLSTLPTPGPIETGRPAVSPLGTTSGFALALAELAVGGAAPVVAPGAMVALPVPDATATVAVAAPGVQDPAATGSDLPVATMATDALTETAATPAGMTVAFETTPAPVPAPVPIPVSFRPAKDVVAGPLPSGDATPTRPVLNDWMPDIPNVCPADLPIEGDAPVAVAVVTVAPVASPEPETATTPIPIVSVETVAPVASRESETTAAPIPVVLAETDAVAPGPTLAIATPAIKGDVIPPPELEPADTAPAKTAPAKQRDTDIAADTAPRRPAVPLSDWTPDTPAVCPADLPVTGNAPTAPQPLVPIEPTPVPVTVAVAAPVAPVMVVAPVAVASLPATPSIPVPDAATKPVAAPAVVPPATEVPIPVAVRVEPTHANSPDAAVAARPLPRPAAGPKLAPAEDDVAESPLSDTPDDPSETEGGDEVKSAPAPSDAPLPARPLPEIAPLPVAPPPSVPQDQSALDPAGDTPVATVTPDRTTVRAGVTRVSVNAAPESGTTEALGENQPAAATKATTAPRVEPRPLPAGDAVVPSVTPPTGDVRPVPPAQPATVYRPVAAAPAPIAATSGAPIAETADARPAPFDVRPAPTPGPAMPPAPPMTVDRPLAAAPAPIAAATKAPVTETTPTTPTIVPSGTRATATSTAVAPTTTERRSSPDAPRVTVTVAAPAVVPTAPSIPQPAAQAFAAAMFAFAEDRREEPRADALLSDIAASLSLSGVGAPATAQPTPVALDSRLPLVDTTRTDWMEKMIDRIETIQGESGKSETRIRLTPDALGNVDVAVTRDASGAIQLRMTSDNPHARTLLAEAAPRLAEMAEARGLKLGGSGVDSGAQGQGQGERRSETATPRQPLRPTATRTEDTSTTTDTRLA